MLQSNQEFNNLEEEADDMPLEGHKSCRSELYADDLYKGSEHSQDKVKIVLKPLF